MNDDKDILILRLKELDNCFLKWQEFIIVSVDWGIKKKSGHFVQ